MATTGSTRKTCNINHLNSLKGPNHGVGSIDNTTI